MRTLSLLVLSVVLFLPEPVKAQSYSEHVHQLLNEAEDFLTVNPAHSLKILDKLGHIQQPAETAIKWHLLVMRAALPINQLERMLSAVEALFVYQQHPLFIQNITTISSATGIWLRRNMYLADAKISLDCAIKYAKNNKQLLTLQNSMGLLSRELGDYAGAKSQFERALILAGDSNNIKVAAMLENNLGLLALENGQHSLAAAHMRNALMHYQTISQRSGQISSALNLMLVFLLQGDMVQYQRLYAPTTTLTVNFPNQAKHALLLWLTSYYEKLTQGEAKADETALRAAFDNLDSPKLQSIIQQTIAPALNLKLAIAAVEFKTGFNRPWFDTIKRCDWPQATTL
ncbi:MAG TPA: hypothetical protein VLA40_11655 [Rheinheimera sp.]|nr:hypothetical protein [Rheinheimera sp.]